ncbi:hypothetical protein GE21DRAFT_9278 [Neurospora crassa]|uniref:Nuclear membrane fusion protein Kar5 n=1 Tax=Neurospora crassa (strain ATCC 24698 / 74-OR23-1A / CBS 708.71 / DSM 1257 / FGSC 987) TaxID=367110 RepID=Q7RZF1_NEUCR|nr:hypothetical protein NCU04067 [Neurospora crassa OR74A]EAA28446.1 hypothetical protein NCU04067 [Neurospora crassa OR74A]KHE81865.1 hypothetical protein GE21DRAFT_9278 [Neurospora crassa]|eukprot:XP_957682.1 hypothetical protein NCU04067 [Neurospora crassa OR74A]
MARKLLFTALCAVTATPSLAFSWGGERKVAVPDHQVNIDRNIQPSDLLRASSRLPNIYAVALSELQELESEPFCHRVAARLLVNNCQLVDGKNDATILTDTGRQVRDFVDSYAASLAICDLERGRFNIPAQCAKFREPALSQIAIRDQAQLHVSSHEIDHCLSAMKSSDAAWNTWISYRHKALRFCEAARADNEKAQNILLYQRLTNVMKNLTEGVEAQLQKQMNRLDLRTQQSMKNLDNLTPQIDKLRDGLAMVHEYLATDVEATLRRSFASLHDSQQQAEDLQKLLNLLLTGVLEGHSRVAHAHEHALQQVSVRANDGIGALVAVVATAAASTTALQQQIELSNQQAAALALRQDNLEQGMDRLLAVTETLATKYEDQTQRLQQASNITNDILDILENTAEAASSVNESLLTGASSRSWWPYIVCPTASLVMGSYGLPPSAVRNLALLALGEVAGFMISSFEQIAGALQSFEAPLYSSVWETSANTTALPYEI